VAAQRERERERERARDADEPLGPLIAEGDAAKKKLLLLLESTCSKFC
jgi:hypothetical protein